MCRDFNEKYLNPLHKPKLFTQSDDQIIGSQEETGEKGATSDNKLKGNFQDDVSECRIKT